MCTFCVDFLGPSVPLNKGQKIHSKIHDKIPAKSKHVVKNGVGKSPQQEDGPDKPGAHKRELNQPFWGSTFFYK